MQSKHDPGSACVTPAVSVSRRDSGASSNGNQSGAWELEPVGCNLCGAVSPKVLFTNDSHGFGLRTVACEQCGLVYLDPRPTQPEYRRFYAGLYEKLFPNGGTPGRFADYAAKQRLEWYREFLKPGTRVLEVGPGGGAFLATVRAGISGATVCGVEPSPLAAAACRERGIEVVEGYLGDLADAGCFDVVAAFHVLEHSLDPTAMLSDISRRLVPNGYFLAEVPNICGCWNGLGMIHIAHPYQYTPRTLAALLEKTGFAVLQIEEMEQRGFECSFRIVARKRPDGPTGWERKLPLDRPDQLSAMFEQRLSNWKRDLLRFRAKRSVLRILGPTMTRALTGKIRWGMFQLSRQLNHDRRTSGRETGKSN